MSRSATRNPRWALSFADLSLLLLGFFVLLQAKPAGAPLAAGLHAALGDPHAGALTLPASQLFVSGEAVLTRPARGQLTGFARGARRLVITSRGTDAAGNRLDRWELAAARAAAVARAFAAAGVPADKIAIQIDTSTKGVQQLALARY